MSTQTIEMPEAWGDVPDDLRFILGYPNFRAGPIAHVYQEAGYAIPRKAEAEQAFVMHLMLKHYFANPTGWRETFGTALDNVIAQIKEAKAEKTA